MVSMSLNYASRPQIGLEHTVPLPLVLQAAAESARNHNQPIAVTIPVDGMTYHEVMGWSRPSPAHPTLNLVVVNAPAEFKKPGSKPTVGQIFSRWGVKPFFEKGGSGAVYVLSNDEKVVALMLLPCLSQLLSLYLG